ELRWLRHRTEQAAPEPAATGSPSAPMPSAPTPSAPTTPTTTAPPPLTSLTSPPLPAPTPLSSTAPLPGRRPVGDAAAASGAATLGAPALPTPSPPSPARARRAVDLETVIGTRWLVFAGAGALFLGIAFLLKWSFDRGLFGPLPRVLGGATLGAALWIA